MDSENSINQDCEQPPEQMVQAIIKSWFIGFEPARLQRLSAFQSGREPSDGQVGSPVLFAIGLWRDTGHAFKNIAKGLVIVVANVIHQGLDTLL